MQSDPERANLHQRMIGKIAAMRGSEALDRGALGVAVTAEYLAVFQDFPAKVLEAGVERACESALGGWRPTPVDVKKACREVVPILARRLLDHTMKQANQSLSEAERADYAKWLADLREQGGRNDPREWGHRRWCAIWGVAYDDFRAAKTDLDKVRLLPQWREYEPEWFEQPEQLGLPTWVPRIVPSEPEPAGVRDFKTLASEGWQ